MRAAWDIPADETDSEEIWDDRSCGISASTRDRPGPRTLCRLMVLDKEGRSAHVHQRDRPDDRRPLRRAGRPLAGRYRVPLLPAEIADHPAYREIIAMGEPAIGLILAELETRPDHWFEALRALTGEDPVPPEARGDAPGDGQGVAGVGPPGGGGSGRGSADRTRVTLV